MLAKAKVLLNRIDSMLINKEILQKDILEYNGVKLDKLKMEVYIDNEQIEIERKQFEVLEYLMENKNSKNSYKVILGEQFYKVEINKNDSIEVYGSTDKYGYIFAQKILINGIELKTYYNIVPNDDLYDNKNELSSNMSEAASVTKPANIVATSDRKIHIDGKVENLVEEDNAYVVFSNAEQDLILEEKANIIDNNKYITKLNKSNSIGEMLVESEIFSDGYIIALTPLSEVSDVIGTMNSYYLIVFIVIFLLLIIISLIYSKFITNPLVEMSNIA